MPEISTNNKIARNTVMLYFRMLLSMLVTLYTSRVVLNILGVEDFGIYNVVGGIVVMLGFLNNAMAVSTQRFLTFELGRQDHKRLKVVFDMSVTIHIIIALIVFVLAETVGVWFLNFYLKIPPTRLHAANWVFQFSVYSFIVTVLSVPYNAAIIANERMKLFASVGILEVILKLAVVYFLVAFSFDKLIFYAFLLFIVSIISRIIYGIYCSKYFEECRGYKFFWDKQLIQNMGSFASWNLLGVAAGIGYNQGVNILLNIFFGPVINAARGIAFQVQGAITNFVTNFQTAVDPAITKMYAAGDYPSVLNLVFSASKFSFYLLLLLSMPLLIETSAVLTWWLKIVPEHTVVFTRLILIDVLVCSLSGSLHILAQASGNVKKYQIIVSGVLLLNLPTSYLFLKFGFSANYTLIISILYSFLALIMRLSILKEQVDLPVKKFVFNVILRVAAVTLFAIILPVLVYFNLPATATRFLIIAGGSIISVALSVYFVGLTSTEKSFLKDQYNQRVKR